MSFAACADDACAYDAFACDVLLRFALCAFASCARRFALCDLRVARCVRHRPPKLVARRVLRFALCELRFARFVLRVARGTLTLFTQLGVSRPPKLVRCACSVARCRVALCTLRVARRALRFACRAWHIDAVRCACSVALCTLRVARRALRFALCELRFARFVVRVARGTLTLFS